jgi:hypothetical protein
VWNATNTRFEYRRSTNVGPLTTGLLIKDKIMYPAELTYYCNGGLRTSNKSKNGDGYPNTATDWANNLNALWTDFSGDVVSSSTMAVALKPNVNYGVALLKTTVRLDPSVDNFADNRAALTAETTNASIAKANLNLELKGVLIGGQCEETGWDFTRRLVNTAEGESGSTGNFEYIIYDNKLAGGSTNLSVPTTTGTTTPNYTIVFDNYNSDKTANAQDKVKVALEFVNKGEPFWGKENLIGTNTTFYLVGELDPNAAGLTALVWDDNYQVPPINNTTGKSEKITRVFIQDYMTDALFTIGANSLQNAYVAVPDLRSTQMTFGLSVDISWRTGLQFNNVPL